MNNQVMDIADASTLITHREKEVLGLLSQGYKVKEIADLLFVSHHTVQSHKKNMIQKFNSRNTVDLIVTAVRSQIV